MTIKAGTFLLLMVTSSLITPPSHAQLFKARQAQKQGEFELAVTLTREALVKVRADYEKQQKRIASGIATGNISQEEEFLAGKLYEAAIILSWNGYYSEVASLYSECVELVRKQGVTDWGYLGLLGKTYNELGEYEKAEAIADQLASKFSGLTTLNEKALFSPVVSWQTPLRIYLGANCHNKAEVYLNKLQPEQGLGKQFYAAQVHYIMSEKITMYLNLGMYGEAEDMANKIFDHWVKYRGEEDWLSLGIKSYLAHVYALLGSLDKAKRIIAEVEGSIANNTKSFKGKKRVAYLYLGLACFEIGDLEKSHEYLNIIEETSEDRSNELNIKWYLIAAEFLSQIEDSKGNTQRAGQLLDNAYAKYVEDIESHNIGLTQDPMYAELMYYYGLHYIHTNDYPKAEEALKKATGNRIRKSLSTRAELMLAQLLVSQGKMKEANAAFTKAIDSSITYFLQSMYSFSEKERTDLLSTIKLGVENFNDFAAAYSVEDPSIAGELYNYQLVMKSLLLRSSVRVMDNIRNTNDHELAAAAIKWQNSRRYLTNVYMLSDEERKARQINLLTLESAIADQEKMLVKKVAGFKDPQSFRKKWRDLQVILEPDEAAVEIIRVTSEKPDRSKYIALILDKISQPKIVNIGNAEVLENRYFKYYRNSITTHSEDKYSYDQFWKPIVTATGNAKRIYLSPDGVYNFINPGAFLNPTSNHYVSEDLTIHTLTNTAVLLDEIQPQTGTDAWLFGSPEFLLNESKTYVPDLRTVPIAMRSLNTRFANSEILPLPGTLAEVNTIGSVLKMASIPAHTLTGAEATEQATRDLPECLILHFATHGLFVDKPAQTTSASIYNPDRAASNALLYSALLLAGAQNTVNGSKIDAASNGVLTAFEVVNLNLSKTKLVVLSACETGLGKVISGEGVYGLPRAFRTAGAQSVLMSLWKVDDEATSLLMSTFYKNWIQNKMTINEAFQSAQAEVRTKYKHPYYWGSFILLDGK